MIPIVFSKDQLVSAKTAPFGGLKPQQVSNLALAESWNQVHEYYPATMNDLTRVHDEEYVQGILYGKTKNGFGTKDSEDNRAIRFTVGNFLEAVRIATNPEKVVIGPKGIAYSLTSGFHHAGHSYGWGYCTFNALMIAASMFHDKNPDAMILVLDGDAHFGDGCVDIIDRCKMDYVEYVSVAGHKVSDYINNLRKITDRINYKEFGLVLYQPGADSLAGDTYHAGTLTLKEFRFRDELVFWAAKNSGTPIVFNLAGGYGAPTEKDTVMAHYYTWTTACDIYIGKLEQDLLPDTPGL